MRIRFIAQYADLNESKINRSFSPAGVSKMDYYLLCLFELGYKVNIFSTCALQNKGFSALKKATNCLGQDICYRSSFKLNNRYFKILDLCWGIFQVLFLLLFCDSKDIVFIYHERYYTPHIKKIVELRKLKVIVDIEEIYCIVHNLPINQANKEISSLKFPKELSKYILATSELCRLLSSQSSYVVCCGAYSPFIKRSRLNDKTQILYGGVLNKNKGIGIVLESARYLSPQEYEINICGFGNLSEIQETERLINENNENKNNCHITWHGKLIGKEYSKLMSNCDIGLACQIVSDDLGNNSFPSKIYEYLRNGLIVISSSVSAIRNSECSEIIKFFNNYTAKDLADLIDRVNKNSESNFQIQQFLFRKHQEFKRNLKRLIDG